jgi:hypothetical protein
VLVPPHRTFANTRYKLLARIGRAKTISSNLMRMSKPVHVLQPGAEVEEIVNIAAIAVVDALFPGYVREIYALQKKVLSMIPRRNYGWRRTWRASWASRSTRSTRGR